MSKLQGTFYQHIQGIPDQALAAAFYPSLQDFELRHTADHGEQIVSKRVFHTGDIVADFLGILLPGQTLFTLQLAVGAYLHDPYFMGKILHSCDPNLVCVMQSRRFYARKAIQAGDVLTMDYETTEDYLFRQFPCRCGSPGCRGVISGRLAFDKQEGHNDR